jgi:hypothetical protein
MGGSSCSDRSGCCSSVCAGRGKRGGHEAGQPRGGQAGCFTGRI